MSTVLDRREFIKLASFLPLSVYAANPTRIQQDSDAKNVFIILFDTLSAMNISLYGYQRETMPNLARFAERANVYHNHFSCGNFTTPGTASLFTGVYPWTHRAIRYDERVIPEFNDKNIFALFDQYYRLAYSHNPLVNTFFSQFSDSLELHKRRQDLYLGNNFGPQAFPNDYDIASLSWTQVIKQQNDRVTNSLFLSELYERYKNKSIQSQVANFPRGVPNIEGDNYFIIEDAIDWVQQTLETLPNPFLYYFHLLPPHVPYNTRRQYVNAFNDGLYWERKTSHIFTAYHTPKYTNQRRREYDEFILYVDAEFGRLLDWMEDNHVFDDTWVIFTSDHGEMFERGILLHEKPVLFQPVIRVPLLISAPGQDTRQDVFSPTSGVDLLPTLLHVNGMYVPDWIEGEVLPPFQTPIERSIFALEARKNVATKPLTRATAMIVRWPYKLVYYWGHPELGGKDLYELYDLEKDPEELENVFSIEDPVSNQLINELRQQIEKADQPYW